jgi:hypothetical protein
MICLHLRESYGIVEKQGLLLEKFHGIRAFSFTNLLLGTYYRKNPNKHTSTNLKTTKKIKMQKKEKTQTVMQELSFTM